MAQKPEIPQKLDDRPEKRYLTTHVRGQLCAAGEKAWKDLGEQLKLSDESLGTIEANARGDVIKGCDSLFKLWLEKQPKASWRQLIEALEVIEQDNLATQIKEKLEPSVASASSSTSTATAPQTQKDGTSLHAAAAATTPSAALWWSNEQVVEILRKSGANVDTTNEYGDTLLHKASQYGDDDVVKVLTTAGVDVNILNESKVSPLYKASDNGHDEVVKLLLAAGANVNEQNKVIISTVPDGTKQNVRLATLEHL